MERHWVLIESGANQRYVFASNKRRQNVGASHLIAQVGGAWLSTAVREHSGTCTVPGGCVVDPVVAASGKGLLLVGAQSCGQDIVGRVTRTAAVEAPGLGVWGAVDDEPATATHVERDGCTCVGCRLEEVHRLHAQARADGRHPESRYPTTPFTEPCAFTDRPAVAMVRESSGLQPRPVSAAFHAAFGKGPDAITELANLTEGDSEGPVQRDLSPAKDDMDPVRNSGWVALIHADGNGVGNLFVDLGREREADVVRLMGGLAKGLKEVTEAALRQAVSWVTANHTLVVRDENGSAIKERDGSFRMRSRDGWILPIVVGGDDVTVIVDGRVALDFVEQLVTAFADQAAAQPGIEAALSALGGSGRAQPPVTLSAGVAFVKPHHPFSDAYDLAEQLCASAKGLWPHQRGAGAVDYHVLYDLVGRDLDDIRKRQVVTGSGGSPLRLWAGPVAVADAPAGAPTMSDLRTAISTFRRRSRDEDATASGTGDVADVGPLSRSSAHSLRTALTIGGAAISVEMERARLRAPQPEIAELAMRDFLEVADPLADSRTLRLSYLLDALALAEVEGTRP